MVVPAARPSDSPTDIWIRQELENGIDTYQRKFGGPFLTSTIARPSGQLLKQLWHRLGNDVDAEDRVLAQQLRETALTKLVSSITA